MRLAAALAALCWAGPVPSAAAEPQVPGPSFEEWISMRTLGDLDLAPDGSRVAFTVRTTDWEENRYDEEIWLVSPGEEPFQLTRTPDGNSDQPRFSPDGRWLAFVADRGDGRQIHLIRTTGGEAQALTAVKEGVETFHWSPDGGRIAFTRSEPESERDKERKERYGDFAVEDREYRQSHLWVVEVAPDPWPSPAEAPCPEGSVGLEDGDGDSSEPADGGGGADPAGMEEPGDAAPARPCARPPEPRRLTGGKDFTVSDFAWSPDGTRIAVERWSDPLITSYVSADLALLDVESGELSPLVARDGFDGGPIWSPDSRWILFSTSAGNITSDFYLNGQLAKVPAAGGEPVRLAADLDENPQALAWSADGILIAAWQRTRRQLFRVDPETGATEVLSTAPEVIWAAELSHDGGTVALLGRTPTTLEEVYLSPAAPFEPRRLTDMSRQLADWPAARSEVIRWESRDGAEVEGVLYKPPGFDPERRYPLLVVIHGGPTAIDYPRPDIGYVYPIPQWLARGALVLKPNYRGSAGYGEAFRSLNVRNLGVGDAWDVLSGVDHLVQQGIVDEERIGAMGWSQGGYISAFLTTHTDRFAAISVGAGISDWVTYYVNTDIHPFTRQYLEATPWEDPEVYAETSPMTTITQASTPTLIQHGELDRRVPIPNAYKLFQGLRDQGIETELIVYKGFGHGITKPKERLAALWHNWAWFARYLWGEEVEPPLGEAEAAEGGGEAAGE